VKSQLRDLVTSLKREVLAPKSQRKPVTRELMPKLLVVAKKVEEKNKEAKISKPQKLKR